MQVNRLKIPDDVIKIVKTYVFDHPSRLVVNLTTFEFAECGVSNTAWHKYLVPLTEKTAILQEDVGESRWKRTDKIVYVPAHLETFVENTYLKL